MSEILRRLSEGRTPWGTIDVSPAAPGPWQRVRLTVYPPGITSGERRLLHLRHAWPVAGGILSLCGLVLLSDVGPVLGLVAVLAFYAGGFLALSRLTRRLRQDCTVLTVASEYVGGGMRRYGDIAALRSATLRLTELESRRRAGRVDPVAYEAEWGAIYESLAGSVGTSRPRSRSSR